MFLGLEDLSCIMIMLNNEIKNYIDQQISEHLHKGIDSRRINLFDLFGMFEVVSAVPTQVPQTIYDQIKIYTNGTTYRLYIYDVTNNAWRYATLT